MSGGYRWQACARAMAALALCNAPGVVRGDVRIATETTGDRHVRASEYAAVIGADGSCSSLSVDGVEFLQAVPDRIPRGGYCWQRGLIRLNDVRHDEDGGVVAVGEPAEVRYSFAEGRATWSIANRSQDTLLYVIVFQADVAAVLGEDGSYSRTPQNRPWSTTTWFRDGRSLEIRGGTRIWGPWAGKHQVWQVDIPAGEMRRVEIIVNAASTEQRAMAQAAAAAPLPAPPPDPVGPMWDMEDLAVPPEVFPAPGFTAPGVQAVFYAGPPYRGNPTRVFAWIGLPERAPGERVPGMVLVHGGGGTAFDAWVRRWTSRGYAAIAMDTCGCVPGGEHGKRPRHEHGGPPGWGGYGQIDDPRQDQWTYHAVSAAIRGHSLLRSLPEVDPDRIGLTGISWGGYLACIVAGVDRRFRLAVPVYGCGFTNEHGFAASIDGLGADRGARWMRWWDPSVYLPGAEMPFLWVTGSNDFAYTLNALQKSYRLPPGPRTLCIRLRMPHGHGNAGEGPAEIFTFADSVLKGGSPLPRIVEQYRDGDRVRVRFDGARPIAKAELNTTRDTGRWQDRVWEATPADLDPAARTVTARIPAGATVYYLNLFDDRDCVVSTEHEELTAP